MVLNGTDDDAIKCKALKTDMDTFYYMNNRGEKPYIKGCAKTDKGYVMVYFLTTDKDTKEYKMLTQKDIDMMEEFVETFISL